MDLFENRETHPHGEQSWITTLSQINKRWKEERLSKEKIWGKPQSKYHK